MSAQDDAVLVSRRWSHHAAHSGYDRLALHVGRPITGLDAFAHAVPDRVFERVRRGMPGYDRTDVGLELAVARHMLTRRGCVYHVVYGDNTYNRLSALVGWRDHRIVVSYHHPPMKLAAYAPERIRRSPSAVILLGRNQLPCFAALLPAERTFVVPYAVDTQFFQPPVEWSARDPATCLFVGVHLRDLDTLRSVVQEARFVAPEIRFEIVAHPDSVQQFQGVAGNFAVHAGLCEADMLRLYQTATLMVLPLHEAVANTSLLEAMACGLPVVVSDVGAVGDYVTEGEACLVPPYDPSVMLSGIRELLACPGKRRVMSASARARALRLSWPAVAASIRDVYERVRRMPARPEPPPAPL